MTIAKKHAGALARAREALDFAQACFEGEARAQGDGEVRGLPVRWSRTCHADGRVVETFQGALGHSCGFDGRQGWRIDESGMLGPLDLADLEDLIVSASVWSGRWLRDDAEITIDGIVSEDTTECILALRVKGDLLPSAGSYRLTLDARTWLPRRLTCVGQEDAALLFDEFRPGGFSALPHRIVHRQAWLEDVLRVETVARASEASAYGSPAPMPQSHTFLRDDDAAIAISSRHGRGKLPLVRVSVDDRDAGWFLVDTGAGALGIDAKVAASLALRTLGRRFVRTADGTAGAAFRRASTLRLGGLTMQAPLFLELDLEPFGRALGTKLGGVLGHDLFMRAVVQIDPEPNVILRPEAIDATWLPLRFQDGCPAVVARFPGPSGPREGLFALDTGSSSAVTIHAGAAALVEMRGGARATLRGITGAGSAMARTLAWFEIGAHRMEDVGALVAGSGAGVTGNAAAGTTGTGILGSIGMGLLRDFTITLDYPGRRLSLERRTRGRNPAPLRARPR